MEYNVENDCYQISPKEYLKLRELKQTLDRRRLRVSRAFATLKFHMKREAEAMTDFELYLQKCFLQIGGVQRLSFDEDYNGPTTKGQGGVKDESPHRS